MKRLAIQIFLLVFAAVALAAPAAVAAPANDDFGASTPLGPGVAAPIVVSADNFGATKQAEEPSLTFGSGHSVWYSWEATETGFVTVGACEADVPVIVGIYTGTTLATLQKAADGNAAEGPDCRYENRQFTFRATAGVVYSIAVDGNGFYLPPSAPPPGEGKFTLRLRKASPPANDAFAAATPLLGSVSEEPDGSRFYFARLESQNREATKEPGEPSHGGDAGGASVWFSWTAPESGTARPSVCCGFGPNLVGVYTGDSVTALTQVTGGPIGVSFAAVAGTTYLIAVDGAGGPSGPVTGSFSLQLGMVLARGPGFLVPGPQPAAVPGQAPAPQTSITKQTLLPGKSQATFRFGSDKPGSRFRCKLDGRRFAGCTSPKTYSGLKPGRHTFAVVAVDAAGVIDASAAKRTFSVPTRRRHP